MSALNDWLFTFTLLAALGCGLIAGVFFAFSAFVMKALERLTAAEGITAMQSINLAVVNPLFLSVFLGTAALCVLGVVSAFLRWQEPDALYLLVGSILYLAGSFLVTAVFNVPKNNRLAEVRPTDPQSAGLWADYLRTWTAWNHFRAIAALAATASLGLALGN